MVFFENIILGCGASGTVCAIECAKNGKQVLVIDKNSKPAKKLLATGNGRCNLSNANLSSDKYNQNIDKFLNRFDFEKTMSFFKSLGLEVYSDGEGRIYPISNTAKSVIDVLTNALENKNISLRLGNTAEKIEKQNDLYVIKTDKEVFSCKKLVFTLGGNTISLFSKNIPLDCEKSSPSLVSLKTQSTRNLANTKISNVEVSVKLKSGKLHTEFGEVLFKESGLSGICIFNISSIFARKQNLNNVVSIDLLPKLSITQLEKLLKERKNLPVCVSKFFDGLFSREIAYEILNRCKTDENKLCSKLSETEISNLAKTIKNLDFSVKGFYDNNQIFAGGVKLDSLTESLESKVHKNLFFAGEACDVDGFCGGYNLQWAWTSGHIVGDAL